MTTTEIGKCDGWGRPEINQRVCGYPTNDWDRLHRNDLVRIYGGEDGQQARWAAICGFITHGWPQKCEAHVDYLPTSLDEVRPLYTHRVAYWVPASRIIRGPMHKAVRLIRLDREEDGYGKRPDVYQLTVGDHHSLCVPNEQIKPAQALYAAEQLMRAGWDMRTGSEDHSALCAVAAWYEWVYETVGPQHRPWAALEILRRGIKLCEQATAPMVRR
jgi:hypothetical protein